MEQSELEIWQALNELPEVESVRGQWHVVDNVIRHDTKELDIVYPLDLACGQDAVWLPPLYDPIRPERSLIGIAKSMGYEINLFTNPYVYSEWVCEVSSHPALGAYSVYAKTPDLALAKAILAAKGEGAMIKGEIDWQKMHEVLKEETDREIAVLEERVRELEAENAELRNLIQDDK